MREIYGSACGYSIFLVDGVWQWRAFGFTGSTSGAQPTAEEAMARAAASMNELEQARAAHKT